MGKYFGTDGFRGEANRTLTAEHAWRIGRFLGHYFGKERRARIVIGKDPRRSSYKGCKYTPYAVWPVDTSDKCTAVRTNR